MLALVGKTGTDPDSERDSVGQDGPCIRKGTDVGSWQQYFALDAQGVPTFVVIGPPGLFSDRYVRGMYEDLRGYLEHAETVRQLRAVPPDGP